MPTRIDGTGQVASAQASPLAGPPILGPVVWATEVDQITNRPSLLITESKDTDPVLFAVMSVKRLPAGTELRADWSFNNTSLDGLSTILKIVRDRSDGWLEFHLEQKGAGPRPDGIYVITVSAGETVLQDADITVVSTD